MQTKTGIIFLQRDKFDIYSPYLPNIFEFRFVPELLQDFDLINRELFENLLKVFLTNNKIPASGIVLVIADNAAFIKDFIQTPVQQQPNPQLPPVLPPTLAELQDQANEYLQLIPFESIASKTYPLANGIRAFATNQEIYEALKNIFEKTGFIFQGVFPGFVFDQSLGTKQSLDAPAIEMILQKAPTLRQYSLIHEGTTVLPVVKPEPIEEVGEKEVMETSNTTVSGGEEVKNNKMIIAAAASVIILILILAGGVLYYQFTNPPYKPPQRQQIPQVAPTQPVSVDQIPTNVAIDVLTAQITYASSSATTTQVNAVKAKLDLYGFQTVDVLPQASLNSAQTLVIFSPRVDAQTKGKVIQDVQSVLPEAVIQERSDATTDITVILGQ
ncbi:MAG TPA: hypothetical protein VLF20_00635 [Patescibacteria group bacterium]|nr:hypothetical protein [Patescibacteria group bacterium]